MNVPNAGNLNVFLGVNRRCLASGCPVSDLEDWNKSPQAIEFRDSPRGDRRDFYWASIVAVEETK